jgi:hypothetical protein
MDGSPPLTMPAVHKLEGCNIGVRAAAHETDTSLEALIPARGQVTTGILPLCGSRFCFSSVLEVSFLTVLPSVFLDLHLLLRLGAATGILGEQGEITQRDGRPNTRLVSLWITMSPFA